MNKRLTIRKPFVLPIITILVSLSWASQAYQQTNQHEALNHAQLAEHQALPIKEKASTKLAANDVKAKATLRALLAQFSHLNANFSQQIIDLQGELLQASSGNILLQKPHKLRWSVSLPEESLLIADGTTVFNIDPFVEQVTLIDQADLTDNNPLMLLISDEDAQWNNVKVQQTEKGFLLHPSDPNAAITQLMLSFDANNDLASMTSVDRQQQMSIIKFSNVTTDGEISSSQFTFQTPKTWVIDDQRKTK